MTFRDNISWYKKMVVEELKNSLTYRIKIDTIYNGYTDTFVVILTDEKTNDKFKTTFENFTEELFMGLDLKTITRETLSRYKDYIPKLYFK